MDFSKEIRILGKGKTASALKDKFINSIWYDDKDFINYNKNNFTQTIVSPGIPPYNSMIKNANSICSDYDLYSNDMPLSIWITGTNGKTTTTQMTQHLLEDYNSQYGGNIGLPICEMDLNKKIWILETSSFTLHYTNIAKPNIFILLPISEDHISWHGTFEEYKNAKLKPLLNMGPEDIAIIPYEYRNIDTQAYLITYKNSSDLASKLDIDISKIAFNEPFLLDALLSMATQKILFDKVDYEKINTFKVDKHKVEEFYDNLGRLWIDDSKATNVDATINALLPYVNKKIYLILGGDDKGADLSLLFKILKNYNLVIFNIGANTRRLDELSETYNIKYKSCVLLENAVDEIKKNHNSNSVAILSPAAASLDQFKSYSHRGEEFKKLVLN